MKPVTTALLLLALSGTASAAETATVRAASPSALETAVQRSQLRARPRLPRAPQLRQDDLSDAAAPASDPNMDYYAGRRTWILGNYVSLGGLIAALAGAAIGIPLLFPAGGVAIIVGSTLAMLGTGRARRAGEALRGDAIDDTLATVGWVCYAAGWVTGVGFGLAHLFALLQMNETDRAIAGISARLDGAFQGSNQGPRIVVRF